MSSLSEQDFLTISTRQKDIKSGEFHHEDVNNIKRRLQTSYRPIVRFRDDHPFETTKKILSSAFDNISPLSHLIVIIIVVPGNYDSGETAIREVCDAWDLEANLIFQIFFENKKSNEVFLMQKENDEQKLTKWMKNHDFDFHHMLNLLSNSNEHSGCEYLRMYIYRNIQKLLDFAITRESLLCLQFLNFFQLSPLNQKNVLKVMTEKRKYQHFLAFLGLNPFVSSDKLKLTSDQFQLLNSVDQRGYSLVMIAVENRSIEVFSFLLKIPVDLNIKCTIMHNGQRKLITVSDLAFMGSHFDFLVELLDFDAPFPLASNYREVCKEKSHQNWQKLKIIESERHNFHNLVRDGKLDEIQKILKNNSKLKHCYYNYGANFENISVLSVALNFNQNKIYSFLKSQGFSEGIDSTYSGSYNAMRSNEAQSKMVSESNKEYFGGSLSNHIIELMSKSKLHACTSNRFEAFDYIKELYIELDEISSIQTLLKIAAYSKCRIVFDLNRDEASDIDPSLPYHSGSGTLKIWGVTYSSGYIYIGCKRDKAEVRGTLAHELNHFALGMKYKNKDKPYYDDEFDFQNTLKVINFNEIIKHLKERPSNEPLIAQALGDSETEVKELIVRPSHLRALYHGNCRKTDGLVNEYSDLFNYYETSVQPDLIKYSALLENDQNILLNDLKERAQCGVSAFFSKDFSIEEVGKFNHVITSDNAILSFYKTYQSIRNSCSGKLLVCAKLERLNEKNYFEEIQKQLNSQNEATLIVVQTRLHEKYQDFGGFKKLFIRNGDYNASFDCVRHKMPSVFDKKLDSDPLKMTQVSTEVIDSEANSGISSGIRWILIIQKLNANFTAILGELKTSITDVTHAWSDLTQEFKNHILESKISLRDTPIGLEDLLEADEELTKDILLQLMSDDRIVVNKIPLTVIPNYIERNFNLHDLKNPDSIEPIPQKEILGLSQSVTVIGDVAGMGKTITLVNFTIKLASKYPDHLILFIDLKTKTDSFKEIYKNQLKDFKNYLTNHLLDDSVTNLEKLIFKCLLGKARVILLLDGFDECSPLFTDFVLKLIKSYLSFEGNKLVMTTRNHMLDELTEVNDSQNFISHEKFSKEDQINFFIRFWERRKPSDSQEITQDYLKDSAFKVMEIFNKSGVSENLKSLVGIPLQAQMLAEITEEYVLQGNLDQFNSAKNLYEFYGQFVKNYLKIRCRKGENAEDDIADNILELSDPMIFHYIEAIRYHTDPETAENFNHKSIKTIKKEALVRIGILQVFGNNKLHFIHATFADYFLVRFFIITLFENEYLWVDLKSISRLLIETLTTDKHAITRTFLNDALMNRSPARMSNNMEPLPEIFHKAIENEKRFSILHEAATKRHYNTLEFIMGVCSNTRKNTKKYFLFLSNTAPKNNVLREILVDKDKNGNSTLTLVLLFIDDPVILDKFLTKLLSIFNNTLKTLFNEKGNRGRNALHSAIFNQNINIYFELSTFLEKKVFDRKEFKSYVSQRDGDGNSIVHLSSRMALNPPFIDEFFNHLEKYYDLNSIENFYGENNEGKNAFLCYCHNANVDQVSFLVEKLKQIFHEISLEQLESLLSSCDNIDCNAFHLIYKSLGSETQFVDLFKNVKVSLPKKLCQQPNQTKSTPLIEILCLGRNKNLVKAFWKVISESFADSELKSLLLDTNINFFHLFSAQENLEIWEVFFEIIECLPATVLTKNDLKNLLTRQDEDKTNLLHWIASNNRNWEVMKFILEKLKAILGTKDFKLFLGVKGSDHKSMFLLLSLSKNIQTLNLIWSMLKNYFSKEMIGVILLQTDFSGRNIMSKFLYKENIDMSQFMWKKILNVLEICDILELLQKEEQDGQSVLYHSALNSDPMLITFVKWTKETLDEDTFVSLFTRKYLNNTVVGLIVRNCRKKHMQAVLYEILDSGLNEVAQQHELPKEIEPLYISNYPSEILPEERLSEALYQAYHSPLDEDPIDQNILETPSFRNLLTVTEDSDGFQNLLKNLSEHKRFIKSLLGENADGEIIFFTILSSAKTPLLLDSLWKILEGKISVTERRTLLLLESLSGMNAIQSTLLNKHCNMFVPLLRCMESVFIFQEIEILLLQKFPGNQTILHFIAQNERICNIDDSFIDELLSRLSFYIKNDEMKSFLNTTDANGNHVLSVCSEELTYFRVSIERLITKSSTRNFFDRLFSLSFF